MLSALGLKVLYVFRLGAVRLPRGSLPRSLCILALKRAARQYRHRLPALLREVRPLDAPWLTFRPVDSMVLDAVYWFGVQGYEGLCAQVWTDICAEAGDILEVGGNIGLFTALGARATSGRYVVVEPVPAVAAILADTIARNNVAHKVTLLRGAAIPGPDERMVALNIPDEGRTAPVGAHLVDGVEVTGRSTQRVLDVPGLPFAPLAAGCDAIKIDAEGIEADLLAAARDAIAARRPAIMVEVLPEAARLGALLAAFARAFDYEIRVIPAYGARRVVVVTPDLFTSAVPRRHNSKDVVLMPRRRAALSPTASASRA